MNIVQMFLIFFSLGIFVNCHYELFANERSETAVERSYERTQLLRSSSISSKACPRALAKWVDDDFENQERFYITYPSEAPICQKHVKFYQEYLNKKNKNSNFTTSSSLLEYYDGQFNSTISSLYKTNLGQCVQSFPEEKAKVAITRFYNVAVKIEEVNKVILSKIANIESVLPDSGAVLSDVECSAGFPDLYKYCNEIKAISQQCSLSKKDKLNDLVQKTKENIPVIENLTNLYLKCLNEGKENILRELPSAAVLAKGGVTPDYQRKYEAWKIDKTKKCEPLEAAISLKKNEIPWIRGEEYKRMNVISGSKTVPDVNDYPTKYNLSDELISKGIVSQLAINKQGLVNSYKNNLKVFRCLAYNDEAQAKCDFSKIRSHLLQLPNINDFIASSYDEKGKEAVKYLESEQCLLERHEDRAQTRSIVDSSIEDMLLTLGTGGLANYAKIIKFLSSFKYTQSVSSGATKGTKFFELANSSLNMYFLGESFESLHKECSKEEEKLISLSKGKDLVKENTCSASGGTISQAKREVSDCILNALITPLSALSVLHDVKNIKGLLGLKLDQSDAVKLENAADSVTPSSKKVILEKTKEPGSVPVFAKQMPIRKNPSFSDGVTDSSRLVKHPNGSYRFVGGEKLDIDFHHVHGEFISEPSGTFNLKIDGGLHTNSGLNDLKQLYPDLKYEEIIFPNDVRIIRFLEPEKVFTKKQLRGITDVANSQQSTLLWNSKTLFPSNWNEVEIEEATRAVLRETVGTRSGDSIYFSGDYFTRSGDFVRMNIYVDLESKKIKSVFPSVSERDFKTLVNSTSYLSPKLQPFIQAKKCHNIDCLKKLAEEIVASEILVMRNEISEEFNKNISEILKGDKRVTVTDKYIQKIGSKKFNTTVVLTRAEKCKKDIECIKRIMDELEKALYEVLIPGYISDLKIAKQGSDYTITNLYKTLYRSTVTDERTEINKFNYAKYEAKKISKKVLNEEENKHWKELTKEIEKAEDKTKGIKDFLSDDSVRRKLRTSISQELEVKIDTDDINEIVVGNERYSVIHYKNKETSDWYTRSKVGRVLGIFGDDDGKVFIVRNERNQRTPAFGKKTPLKDEEYLNAENKNSLMRKLKQLKIENPEEQLGEIQAYCYLFNKSVQFDALYVDKGRLKISYYLINNFSRNTSIPSLTERLPNQISEQFLIKLRNYSDEQIIKDFRGILTSRKIAELIGRKNMLLATYSN